MRSGGLIIAGLAGAALGAVPVQAAQAAKACLRAVRLVGAGDVPKADDFSAVDCPSRAPLAAFRYDRQAGAARATRSLAPGELVPALPAFAMPAATPGQMLSVSAHIGAATVERRVQALQAGAPGGRIFVRAEDGQVFPVTLPRGGQ